MGLGGAKELLTSDLTRSNVTSRPDLKKLSVSCYKDLLS